MVGFYLHKRLVMIANTNIFRVGFFASQIQNN